MGTWPKSFETVMSDVKGWPSLDDFKHRRVFIDDQLVSMVESLIKNHRCCLIRGAEGRGKTVLARIIGFNKHNEKWKIRFIDVQDVIEEEIDQICNAIKTIGNKKTLFIIENAHSSLDEITPRLIESANDHQESSFIFTARKIFPGDEELFISNPFEEWEEEGWCVDLNPDIELAYSITRTFILAGNMNYNLTDQDKDWMKEEFGEQAINLRRLKWYLETWSETGDPLSSISKEKILKKVLNYYIKEINDRELERMLLRIACVFQFGIDFYGGDYNGSLRELVEKGIVTPLEGNYYRLQHSSDAEYIVEAMATLREKRTSEYITIDFLKEYLKRRPRNYYELIRTLYRNRKKQILSEIFGDQETYKVVFNMVSQDSIRVLSSVLVSLTFACGKEKGWEFWSQYKEEQEKKLKDKLSQASVIEICFLLHLVNEVDANEKNWLANDVLDEDVLVQKIENGTKNLNTISNLLNMLPDNKVIAIISKLDPYIMTEKAKSSNIQAIVWFLRDCSQDPANMNFARAFLSNIKTELTERLKESGFSMINNCLKYIKKIDLDLYLDLYSDIIFKLDPNAIAEKAKSSSIQKITWFLRDCSQDPANINFARSFLSNIKTELTERLKESDLSIVYNCLQSIRKIDSDLHGEIKDSLYNSANWMETLCQAPLATISYKLYIYRQTTGEPRRFAQSLVSGLASTDLPERIKKLYINPQANPIKVLSTLLNWSHQIAFDTDKDAVQKIAQEIVDNIDLKIVKNDIIGNLSHLVTNVKKCNELTYEQICNRILSEMNLLDYVGIPFKEGLAVLIWHINHYNEEKAQEITDRIFKLEFDELLDKSDTEAVSRLIWNLLQIDELGVRNWIQNTKGDKWVKKALSSSTHDAFWLLWSLYHADEEKAKSIGRSLSNDILSNYKIAEVEDLPLLGLFAFFDIQVNVSIPTPDEIAKKIVEDPNLAQWAFCVYLLKQKSTKLAKSLSKGLQKQFRLRDQVFPMGKMLEEYPFENTKQLFVEIFKDLGIPKHVSN